LQDFSLRMKRILLPFFVLVVLTCQAQILEPAHWSTSTSVQEAKVGDELDLIFSVTIDKNWYLYSTEFPCEDGPLKTEFTFTPHNSYKLVGKVVPMNPKDKYDKIFECDVKIFEKTAEFRQRVKVLAGSVKIAGTYDYQICTEIDGSCIPASGDFSFTQLKVSGGAAVTQPKFEEPKMDVIPVDTVKREEVKVVYSKNTGPVLDKAILEGNPEFDSDSFWAALIFAFIAGFTALITPCVFPMIPMTVTFFLKDTQTKREGIRKALIFGLSIITLYSTAGTLFANILGPDGLNALATNWALNLFIFVVFVVFALSFFGLFEINAPYQLVNKIDQKAEKGGLVGVFFMAFTLVLISFSCTVPIVSTVLAMSAGGQVLKPVLMMFSYSLAFALPFVFFAFFPELIKSMPKSGGWLNTVKVSLGFIELALALKFFSIADQAYHWGLLDRDVNLVLWIVIFSFLGFYLLGKIKMKHDSDVVSVGVGRLMLAIASFSFVVYLIPGLIGAPLKALAGYLPPMHSLSFNLNKNNITGADVCAEPKYADFLHLPHGLKGYYEYEQALACAREQNKPLFIDFTGHGCTNCREMEAVVWSDPAVLQRLNNDFVVVALYVDDKTPLPESEWITSKYDKKVKTTIGKKNADIQIANLENNAQPYYVLVGKDEKVLAWPYAYNRDPQKFVEFLERGKKKFKELYQ
jgi:thiol:disulfide interchange protein